MFLRRAMFQIHLWAGIIAGLYIFVVGVTGSAIVFRDEIELKTYASLQHVSDSTASAVMYTQVAEIVKRNHPEWNVFGIYPPAGERNTIMVYINRGENFQAVFIHPGTGRELGRVDPTRSLLRWLEDLHVNLLGGTTGRAVNGIGAFALLLLCVTGLIVWWPGRRRWKSALTVDFSRRWKRINWDLHSVVGFWTLGVLLIWGVSGVYFCFPAAFTSAVNWFSRVSPTEFFSAVPHAGEHAPRLSIEKVLKASATQAAGETLIGVLLPIGPRGTYTLTYSPDGSANFDKANFLYVDQYSGKLLSIWNRRTSKTFGDLIMNWMAPLHFGTFGSVPVKILWVILGLSLPLLFVTGAIMWWQRVLQRQYRHWRHKKESGRVAAANRNYQASAAGSSRT